MTTKPCAAAVVVAMTSLALVACGLLADSPERGERLPDVDDGSRAAGDAVDAIDAVDAQPEAQAEAVTPVVPPGPQCAALGGRCVAGRWANCPSGTQPTEDIHADCMPATATRGYFCCVPAPPSPCASDDGLLDCFANGCEKCWIASDKAPSTCAGGRTCCAYACPD